MTFGISSERTGVKSRTLSGVGRRDLTATPVCATMSGVFHSDGAQIHLGSGNVRHGDIAHGGNGREFARGAPDCCNGTMCPRHRPMNSSPMNRKGSQAAGCD